MHLWGEWTLVASKQFRFNDRPQDRLNLREWRREEFVQLLQRGLEAGRLEEAPFWVGFAPEQNGRNALVPAGKDVSWPNLTQVKGNSVISAFKLLERWRDADLKLILSPLWQESE